MTVFAPHCVLVTGGAGFIGGNFVRWLLQRDHEVSVVNLDLLTYAGNLESLDDVARAHGVAGDGRYYFIHGDIRDFDTVARILRGEMPETATPRAPARAAPAPEAVAHFAAAS